MCLIRAGPKLCWTVTPLSSSMAVIVCVKERGGEFIAGVDGKDVKVYCQIGQMVGSRAISRSGTAVLEPVRVNSTTSAEFQPSAQKAEGNPV